MDFPTLTITQKPRSNGRASRRRSVKSRSFQATLLMYLTADRLWALGQAGQAMRPVWISYAAPHEMGRAFTANLRGGHKAKVTGGGDVIMELPKSAPHRWLSQRTDGGATLTTAYLSGLFDLDPGEPKERIAFVFMPPRRWLERQAQDLEPEFRDAAADVARAALFAAFLDRRSPLPLVHDLRFQLQLYRAALETPWTQGARTLRHGEGDLWAVSAAACGLDGPRLVDVSHQDFEAFLKAQTADYFAKEIAHGTHRVRPDRWLLPYPERAPRQLRLDLAVA